MFICASCVELCHNIIRQEKRRLKTTRPVVDRIPAPRQIKEYLAGRGVKVRMVG